jgi:hypothetical protein
LEGGAAFAVVAERVVVAAGGGGGEVEVDAGFFAEEFSGRRGRLVVSCGRCKSWRMVDGADEGGVFQGVVEGDAAIAAFAGDLGAAG